MRIMQNYKWAGIPFLSFILLAGGCKKYLKVDLPTNQVFTTQVFNDDAGAGMAVAGLYRNMESFYVLTEYPSLSADELSYYNSNDLARNQLKANQLTVDNGLSSQCWTILYKEIYLANSIIENAQASTGMSASFKAQAIGEAKFIRAFCHFYLVNLFGKAPLIITTDVTKTAYAPRTSVDSLYKQIKADLMDGMNNLQNDYANSSIERIRANRWAAAALLARVYLYTSDWANAETMASSVITSGNYSLLDSANIGTVFLKNSNETILQFQPGRGFTEEGVTFGFVSSFGYFQYPMDTTLLMNFEPGDLRRSKWIATATYNNSYGNGTFSAPGKYHRGATNEYSVMLRLAEQYLIRAEARVQQTNISGAQSDINAIRKRAGVGNTTMVDKPTAMAAIEKERQRELFCEWGHRWFDLKRLASLLSPGAKTRADDVLGALKTTWASSAVLYPIPLNAIQTNPFLTQNDGYSF